MIQLSKLSIKSDFFQEKYYEYFKYDVGKWWLLERLADS